MRWQVFLFMLLWLVIYISYHPALSPTPTHANTHLELRQELVHAGQQRLRGVGRGLHARRAVVDDHAVGGWVGGWIELESVGK